MGCEGCRGCVAFLLKFLNFIQAFIGVSMILYSVWMLHHWKSQVHPPPPSIAPSPGFEGDDLSGELMLRSSFNGRLEAPLSNPRTITAADHLQFRKLGEFSSGSAVGLDFAADKLPVPWFIYTFLGIGIILSLVTCSGYIAAEATNGCCLCCYSVFIIFLMLLEAALVGDILFNHHWEKDIPEDPTGELENVKEFIKDNIDICKWVGLGVVIIQGFSLLLALILRAMVSTRKINYDSDEDYIAPPRTIRQPLLGNQGAQGSPVVSGENRSNRPDAWTTRMREKYGLNTNDFAYDPTDPKNQVSTGTSGDDGERRCVIM